MKTRRFLGLVALATLTLGSCSNDEVVNDYSQDNAIEFGTYVGRDAQSRASVTTTENLFDFGVFAFYRNDGAAAGADPNFMNNQKVYRDEKSPLDNGWNYSPVKYWPNEAKDVIDFYAYAPFEYDKVWNENNVIVEINPEVTEQKDYLWASPVTGQGKQAIKEDVVFTFHHALTRVGFKVEAVINEVNDQENGDNPDTDNQKWDYYDNATTVSVQEVELIGPFFSKARLSLADGTLSDLTGEETKSYSLGYADFVKEVADKVTTVKQQLNTPSEYMMFIPSEYKNIKVRVKYTVTTKDDKLTEKEIAVVNDITSEAFDFTFEQGHAYNFVLHLGLTSVKLSATVGEWKDGGDVVVNVPINFSK